MRPEAMAADRRRAVREAARSWAKAGAIDGTTLSKIEAEYADDRVRLRWGLAALAGTATFFGGAAVVIAFVFLMSPERTGAGILLVLFAAAFGVATEIQCGRLRRARAGAELATAWLAALCLFAASAVFLSDGTFDEWPALLAVPFGWGAYRWGFSSLAGFAWLTLLVGLAALPWGRLGWIVASLVALALTGARSRAEKAPPAHRRCLRVVFAGALLALYFAVHYDTVKASVIEWIGTPRTWGPGTLAVSAVLTALLPVAILYFGIKRRDRIAIAIGALLVGVSLATWRLHWPWLPMWLTLTAGGAACFVTAILVRRFLDRSASREWRGITADPLFDDPAHAAALRVAAVAATLGHAPRASSGDRPFQAGGGTSGGGGAQGQF